MPIYASLLHHSQNAQQCCIANSTFTLPPLLSLYTLPPCHCVNLGVSWTGHLAACRKEVLWNVLNCHKSTTEVSCQSSVSWLYKYFDVCKEIEFTFRRRSLLTESVLNPVFYLSFNAKGPCSLVSVVCGLSLWQLGLCCYPW